MHVGSTPEACTAVLFTPPLGDGEVMVIQGARAMIEMDGYGREAKLKAVVQDIHGTGANTFFMDALELNSYDTCNGRYVPDILPGNVDRVSTKAFTAFNSS